MNKLTNQFGKLSTSLFAPHQKLNTINYLYITKANKSEAAAAIKYATAASCLFLMVNYRKLKNQIQGKKPVVYEYPKDTVVLHQFPRAYNTPSLSMFALKLETWCRAAGIKYQNKFGMERSSQGLIPFIKLNNYVVEDSSRCIEYLTKVMDVNLNAGLTDEQKAVARAVHKMTEESLKWSIVLYRFWHSDSGRKEMGLPLLAYWLFSYKVYKTCWYNGYARMSKEDIIDIAKKDLNALNTLIGKKKYLFSDSEPCDADFAIFGVCSQIKFNDRGPINHHLITECPHLNRQIDNIKEAYWKDWNEVIGANKNKLKKLK